MEILWLAVAYVLGLVVSRFKIPPLVGYLLAGANYLVIGMGQAGASAVCLPMAQACKKLAELILEKGESGSRSLNLSF